MEVCIIDELCMRFCCISVEPLVDSYFFSKPQSICMYNSIKAHPL